MANFQEYNINPWKKDTKDCAIRAILTGSLYGYKYLCDELGGIFSFGTGCISGIPLKNNKLFADKTKIMTDYFLELDDSFNVKKSDLDNFQKYGGFTVNFWMDNLKMTEENKKIIFICKSNPQNKIDLNSDTIKYHVVYGNLKNRTIYDTWDSRDCIVLDSYVISKVAKEDDPLYYKNDLKKLVADREKIMKSDDMKEFLKMLSKAKK